MDLNELNLKLKRIKNIKMLIQDKNGFLGAYYGTKTMGMFKVIIENEKIRYTKLPIDILTANELCCDLIHHKVGYYD